MELYPDATGRRAVEPTADPVLLGSAMTAATAARLHPTLGAAGAAMHQDGTLREPDPTTAARYERDWRVFIEMQRHRVRVEELGPR
jgi:ribulose kinase